MKAKIKTTLSKKRVLKRLAASKRDRGPVTLYLSRKLMNRFKKACGDYSASEVIEEMMKDFITQKA